MRVWHEVVEVWREGAEWVCGLRLMRWRHRKGLLSQGTRRMDGGWQAVVEVWRGRGEWLWLVLDEVMTRQRHA